MRPFIHRFRSEVRTKADDNVLVIIATLRFLYMLEYRVLALIVSAIVVI